MKFTLEEKNHQGDERQIVGSFSALDEENNVVLFLSRYGIVEVVPNSKGHTKEDQTKVLHTIISITQKEVRDCVTPRELSDCIYKLTMLKVEVDFNYITFGKDTRTGADEKLEKHVFVSVDKIKKVTPIENIYTMKIAFKSERMRLTINTLSLPNLNNLEAITYQEILSQYTKFGQGKELHIALLERTVGKECLKKTVKALEINYDKVVQFENMKEELLCVSAMP